MLLKSNPNCQLCRLHKTTSNVCILGTGDQRSSVMIVGEAPGGNEERRGEPFIGKAGQLLRSLLESNGIKPESCYITNAVHCRPPGNKTPTKAEIRSCKTWLDAEIDEIRPSFVLLLGNTPLQSITGKAGIKSARGRPFEIDGVIYFPTYHPAACFYDTSNEVFLREDISNFFTLVNSGGMPRAKDLNPILVDTWEVFDEMLLALEGTVSYDLETTGLYPWADDSAVISIGFGTEGAEWCLPVEHPETMWKEEDIVYMVKKISKRLKDCYVVCHNGKFDALWMLLFYGVFWYFDFDTMIAHYLWDENDRHGLKYLAKVYFGAPDWEIDKDEKKGAGPLKRHIVYLAHDVHYTRKLKFKLNKKIKTDTRINKVFRRIMMPIAREFTWVEYNGVFVDVHRMDEVENYLRREKDRAETELRKYGDINWGAPQQVAGILFGELGIDPIQKTKGGKDSVAEGVLQRIDHPVARALLTYRGHSKNLSAFIEGWQPFLSHGRIHPSFKLNGTVTGRFSCEHPNLQQVPRDPMIRSLITAPPSWVLLEADLSQIELRIAAELSGDQSMMKAFEEGTDVHWLTAIREISRGGGLKDLVLETAARHSNRELNYGEAIEILLRIGHSAAEEINPAWKEFRKKAKAINFGYLYGMWWKKFKIYAFENYGVVITDHEAKESYSFYFSLYSELKEWHKRQKRFAERNGFVRSLSGRKRRLPDALEWDDTPAKREALRQAINAPVQSFANELNLMALLELREEFSRDVMKVVGAIHDAILMEVRESWVEKVYTRAVEVMRHPKLLDELGIKLRVPLEAEAKIGPWGKGVSLEKWKAPR